MSHTDKHTLGGTAHHDPDTLANLNALISGLTGALRDIGIGPLSSRPVAGTADRLWFATDQLALYRDTGTVWEASRSWQQSVRSLAISTPASPELGERHLINPGASGEFGAHANQIATCLTTAPDPVTWSYVSPESGWVVMVADDYGGNAIYEYFAWNPMYGAPPSELRADGWQLRTNQNVGTSGVPSFLQVSLQQTPAHFPNRAVRREELRQYSWQDSIISAQNTPPGSPNPGDRYIVLDDAPTDDWVGFENQIAVWQPELGNQAPMWVFYPPEEGWTVYNKGNDNFYSYDAVTSKWTLQGSFLTPFDKPMLKLAAVGPDSNYAARVDQLFSSVFGHVVVTSALADAPGGPADWARYIVAPGTTPFDPWDGQTGKIAIARPAFVPVDVQLDGVTAGLSPGWIFVTPVQGTVAFDQATGAYIEYNGAAWVSHLPESHASSHVTGGTDEIPGASAVSSGLINLIAQTLAGQKTFLEAIRIAVLNSGDEIITTDTNGQLQESGVKVTVAPAGGSGFTFVEYAVAPVNPPAGFVWVQAKDANTKTLNYYNGVSTFSVDLSV